MQTCKRCLMDSTVPEIKFDDNGFCNLCTHAIERLINESENRYQNFDKIIEYLKTIKKKLGIGGCLKKMEDYDEKNDVFLFTGEYSEKIKDYLVKNCNKNEDFIKFHG